MWNVIWERLEVWVCKENGMSFKKLIICDMQLYNDLDVDGDEVEDFMEYFFEEFFIDYGDYNFDYYFVVEGFNLIEIFLFMILKKKWVFYDRLFIIFGMFYQVVFDG